MKCLIKKQEKEFDEMFDIDVVVGSDNKPYQHACMNNNGKCDFVTNNNIKNFISKIRKETAEETCDKIKRNLQNDIRSVINMLEGSTDRQKIANLKLGLIKVKIEKL